MDRKKMLARFAARHRKSKKRFGVDPNRNPWDAGAKGGGTVPDYSGIPNKPYAALKARRP